MTKDEAMKLRTAAEKVVELCSERPLSLGKWFIDMSEACESLQEALAEQPAQQEPVAWICEGSQHDEKHSIDYWPGDVDDLPIGTKLYTQAQRTWVGLTDEEIQSEWVLTPQNDKAEGIWFGRRIEAKLKEKNT